MKKKALTFLLIHPEVSRTKYNFAGVIENECLELEYISAMLKEEGHAVHIYDTQVENRKINRVLLDINPDVVYICGRTKQENFILEYCKLTKAYNSKIVTIIGGIHAQLCYERMYRSYVDYILSTFDIYKILDIVSYAFYSSTITLDSISGLSYRQDNKWLHNPSEPFDINRLPLPDRSYFYAHPNRYRYLELEHAAWVRTAYSCPYQCAFCIRNRMNSEKYVWRDIDAVVDEIQAIESKNIYIVDDDFLLNVTRINRFIKLIKERDIHKNYICYGRADFIAKHPDLMKELKSIGLYYVLVGLEAIENVNLKSYNKHSSVSNNVKSIDICNKLDIHIMGMFILDLSYTPRNFRRLYGWIKYHNLRNVAISIFTPEPGLETYDIYADRLITDNPAHFDYLHVVATPEHMSVKQYYIHYYRLLIKLFLKAKREGVYDFIDYGYYIKSFITNIFSLGPKDK